MLRIARCLQRSFGPCTCNTLLYRVKTAEHIVEILSSSGSPISLSSFRSKRHYTKFRRGHSWRSVEGYTLYIETTQQVTWGSMDGRVLGNCMCFIEQCRNADTLNSFCGFCAFSPKIMNFVYKANETSRITIASVSSAVLLRSALHIDIYLPTYL